MFENPLLLLAMGLIPLVIGSVWYGPLFGKSWMNVNGYNEEDLQGGNMILIMGLSYILGIFLAVGLSGLTNHQSGVMQLFAMHPDFQTVGTEVGDLYKAVMDRFGNTHRTLGHGALHGAFGAFTLALPLVAINSLFERRGWKYIGIHFGYWLVTFVALGAAVCAWL